jgi:hypothetical protein
MVADGAQKERRDKARAAGIVARSAASDLFGATTMLVKASLARISMIFQLMQQITRQASA